MKGLPALRPLANYAATLAIALTALAMLLLLRSASAAPGDEVADRVIGQGGSFASGTCNLGGVSASSLCAPQTGIAGDSQGHLYVADSINNRVLEYDNPLTSAVANRVFGQGGSFSSNTSNLGGVTASSLNHPAGVAVDGSGNLYIVDFANHRVLEYDSPLTTDTVADRVFGQGGSLTSAGSNQGGISASSLSAPVGVAVDSSGNLYVSDFSNNRVLEYDSPLTTDTVADRVFGQGGSFTTSTLNLGGRSASSLYGPYGIAVDASGNLYVADDGNNRVLQYTSPLTSDAIADRVFGQGGSFTTGTCNQSGVSASSLCLPSGAGVAVDAAGNLYVAEFENNRTLEFDTPVTTDTVADRVFGQASFGANSCNEGVGPSSSRLCHPLGVGVDCAGNVYVGDTSNHRVLEYDVPIAPAPCAVTPTPTPVAVLDHFKCYDVTGGQLHNEVVTLTDEFGTIQGTLNSVFELCNPVEKTHNNVITSITNPDSHLVWYDLADDTPKDTRLVNISNQFGTATLTVSDARLLFVPSQKLPHGPPHDLDHFLCYLGLGSVAALSVDLTDQFRVEAPIQVGSSSFFCNPVQKTHNSQTIPITNPDAHLLCYNIGGTFFPTTRQINNQFGPETLTTTFGSHLCVPTQVLAVNTPTATPGTITPTPTPGTITPTPTPGTSTPTASPSPTPTGTSATPTATGPVGGLVDVVHAGSAADGGTGPLLLLIGALLVVAVAGAFAFRRASLR